MRTVIYIQINGIRRKLVSVLILLVIKASAIGQINNNGASIVIDSGSSIVCIGNFNNATGTISNEGKLEIRGSFTNSSFYNSRSKNDSLLLTGSGAVNLGLGSDIVAHLLVIKVDSGSTTLSSNLLVSKSFTLLAGAFSTDLQKPYELIAPTSASFNFADSTYILGKVRRTQWTNETSVVFNHPNMLVKTTTGVAPTNMLVNLVPVENLPVPETEVKYNYYFTPFSGRNYAAEVTFPYGFAGFNESIESGLLPAYYTLDGWKTKFIGNVLDTAADYVRSIGIVSKLFENSRWKLAIPSSRPNTTASDVYVYPIPASDNLNIVLTADKNYKVKISLLDMSGKLCRVAEKGVIEGPNYLNINIAGLSTGKYILKLERGSSVQTKVILIKH